jgi:hypothetical protein
VRTPDNLVTGICSSVFGLTSLRNKDCVPPFWSGPGPHKIPRLRAGSVTVGQGYWRSSVTRVRMKIYAVRKAPLTIALLCAVVAPSHGQELQCAPQAQLCRIRCDDQWLPSPCVGTTGTQKSSCYYNASTNLKDCRHYCLTNYCARGQAPQPGGHGWAPARGR